MGDPVFLFGGAPNHFPDNSLKFTFSLFCSWIMIILALICFWETRPYPVQTLRWSAGRSKGSVFPWFYLLPLLLPAGGFLSWRRGPPVTKPAAGGLDTPKVRPAEGLMPGLLKLKPELLLLPKPRKARECTGHKKRKLWEKLEKTKVMEQINDKDAQEIYRF